MSARMQCLQERACHTLQSSKAHVATTKLDGSFHGKAFAFNKGSGHAYLQALSCAGQPIVVFSMQAE